MVVRRLSSSTQTLHEEPIETYRRPSRPTPRDREVCSDGVEFGSSPKISGVPTGLPSVHRTRITAGVVAM